jgi:hypothetical protein
MGADAKHRVPASVLPCLPRLLGAYMRWDRRTQSRTDVSP